MKKDTILVPVDFTGSAFEVVASAAAIAGRLNSDVALLYVVKLPAGLSPDTMIHPHGSEGAIKAIEYLDEDARQHLQPFVQIFKDAGCDVGITLGHGDICSAILESCDTVGASMIIMGTHGRKGLRRLVEGSVAEDVIRRASCPVITIRTQAPTEHPGLSEAQEQALIESAG